MDSISEEYSVDQAATGPDRSEPVVSVRGLVKRYGSHEAVAGIDLEVRRGEIFAFLGPNGAGKTTTVEILEGFRQPTEGQVSSWGTTRPRRAAPGGTGWAWSCRSRSPSPACPSGSAWPCTPGSIARREISTRPSPWSVSPARRARSGTRLSGGQRRRLDFFAVTEKVEALYGQDPVLPADAIGPKMARLRREHHRMLGNGWCTRPPELGLRVRVHLRDLHLLPDQHRVPPHPRRPARRRPRPAPRPPRAAVRLAAHPR